MADCVGVDLTKGTDKTCAACGDAFTDTSPGRNARFCGRRCWRRAKARRTAGKPERDAVSVEACIACGASLAGRKHGTRCCSDACYQRARRRSKYGQPVVDSGLARPCVRCGSPVLRGHWSFVRFCSKRCSENYWANEYAKRKRPVIYRKCLACSADIAPEANLRRKYCNKVCAGRNRSPEVVFRYVNARRARLAGASAYPLPKRVLRRLRGAQCTYCGGPGGTVDHLVPLSRGGQHAEGNLVPACRSCNSSKRDKLLIEWLILRRASVAP